MTGLQLDATPFITTLRSSFYTQQTHLPKPWAARMILQQHSRVNNQLNNLTDRPVGKSILLARSSHAKQSHQSWTR